MVHARRVAACGRVNQWIGSFYRRMGARLPSDRDNLGGSEQLGGGSIDLGWNRCDRTAGTSGGGRIFRWRVEERGVFDWAVLDCSSKVVSQGFDWYMHQLETRTGRKKTEEDRAMRDGGSNDGARKLLERG